jgi:chemotaxis protein CheX
MAGYTSRTTHKMADMTQASSHLLTLAPRLDLSAAEALAVEFRVALETALPITVDASDVETVSTPCIQIMVSALRQAFEHGTDFHIVHPSDALREAVVLFSLQSTFATEEFRQ